MSTLSPPLQDPGVQQKLLPNNNKLNLNNHLLKDSNTKDHLEDLEGPGEEVEADLEVFKEQPRLGLQPRLLSCTRQCPIPRSPILQELTQEFQLKLL